MEKDTHKTKVVFRMWKGRVIALFPEIDERKYYCLSYEHIGQHGGADYQGIVAESKLATPDEYTDLFEELESIGYNLDIRKRR